MCAMRHQVTQLSKRRVSNYTSKSNCALNTPLGLNTAEVEGNWGLLTQFSQTVKWRVRGEECSVFNTLWVSKYLKLISTTIPKVQCLGMLNNEWISFSPHRRLLNSIQHHLLFYYIFSHNCFYVIRVFGMKKKWLVISQVLESRVHLSIILELFKNGLTACFFFFLITIFSHYNGFIITFLFTLQFVTWEWIIDLFRETF